MKKIIALILVVIINKTSFAQIKFVKHFKVWEGTWEMKSSNGTTIESWDLLNDSTFFGKTILIKQDGDTILKETIELLQRDELILYMPQVVNQNNNQPVAFTLTEFNNTYFVFENKTHDFPQKISYDFTTKDRLIATIEGVRQKIRKKIEFDYKRIE